MHKFLLINCGIGEFLIQALAERLMNDLGRVAKTGFRLYWRDLSAPGIVAKQQKPGSK